jgi:hypothetical protein
MPIIRASRTLLGRFNAQLLIGYYPIPIACQLITRSQVVIGYVVCMIGTAAISEAAFLSLYRPLPIP